MQLSRLLITSIPLLAYLTQISAVPAALPQAARVDGTPLKGALDNGPAGDQAPVMEQSASNSPGRKLTQCNALQNQITVRLGTTTTAVFTLAKCAWVIGWGVINDLVIEKCVLSLFGSHELT